MWLQDECTIGQKACDRPLECANDLCISTTDTVMLDVAHLVVVIVARVTCGAHDGLAELEDCRRGVLPKIDLPNAEPFNERCQDRYPTHVGIIVTSTC